MSSLNRRKPVAMGLRNLGIGLTGGYPQQHLELAFRALYLHAMRLLERWLSGNTIANATSCTQPSVSPLRGTKALIATAPRQVPG